MPTPLHLSDEEMDLLLALGAPIDQRQRTQFLTEVTAAIEEEAARTASALAWCTGWRARFRGAISIRRSCPTQARRRAPKGRSSKLEHYGRGRDYRSSSVLAFSDRPALVPPNESIDGRGRDAVAASSVPVTSL